MVVWLEDISLRAPEVLPSPFDDVAPDPIAQTCAQRLMATLRGGFIAPGVSTELLYTPGGGKMFGVLVVEGPGKRLGFLQAFSGQLDRAWRVDGFVPPIFEGTERERLEPAIEATVKGLTERVERSRADPRLLAARASLNSVLERTLHRRVELKAKHLANKAQRRQRRLTAEPSEQRALDGLSRADDAERRSHEASAREQVARAQATLAPLERTVAALERLRRLVSQEAMRRIFDSYRLTNFSGASTPLRALFPSGPASGAGDCAAPKLFEAARRAGLRPVALAEFWWGAPPPGGGRVEGTFFPACKEKCGPILSFQLQGLQVAARRTWKPREVREAELYVVLRDERFVVVEKPSGMLSVPARDATVTDSLQARVQRQWPEALAVHRLDLDTSGLLVVALDLDCYRLLQAQFVAREVHKRYLAWLDGHVPSDFGVIELPLRVDLEQRPRQLVDFEHGKSAITRYEVLDRQRAHTQVAFFPLTGRTHQLRVHAAHPKGLNAPIVGDRLYGTPGPRLMLHAAELRFRHPFGGQSIEVISRLGLPDP
jgi:tRNA pseudouridine32 synthase / 23S rRNA pseudouridine746 synthase